MKPLLSLRILPYIRSPFIHAHSNDEENLYKLDKLQNKLPEIC